MPSEKVRGVLAGCVLSKSRDFPLFAFQPDARPHGSSFRVRTPQQWAHYDTEPAWAAIGMATAKYPGHEDFVVVASSSEGELWELIPGNKTERTTRIAGERGGITKLAAIDNAIWACGMGRLVLRREADGTWTDHSASEPRLDGGVVGFTALAGDASGIVAVGWKGEIWMRRDERWTAQVSPTRATLTAVSLGPRGDYVAVGDGGTIVVGREGTWSALEASDEDLQGVCHFRDEVFVCSASQLHVFDGKELTPETRFGSDGRPATCLNLFASGATLVSQGEKSIYLFEDGAWKRLF